MDKCFCHLNGYKVKDADARHMLSGEVGMGNIRVGSIEGKNLLIPNFQTQSGGGITVEYTKNGWLVNGEVTSNSTSFIIFNGNLPAGNYVINGITGASNTTYQLVLRKNGVTHKYITNINTTFTLDEDMEITLELYTYKSNGTFNNLLLPYQLEKGSVATEYAPYFEIGAGASNGSGECEIFKVFMPVDNKITNLSNGYNVASFEGVKNGLNEFISKCKSDGNYNRILHLGIGTYNNIYQSYLFTSYQKGSVSYGSNGYTERKYKCIDTDYSNSSYASSGSYTIYYELVIQEKEDGTVDVARLYNTSFRNISHNNTLLFTPTSDYNLVHKKYVDDLVYKSGFYEIKGDFSNIKCGDHSYFMTQITDSSILSTIKTFIQYVKTNGLTAPRISLVNTVTSKEEDGVTITYPTNIDFSNMRVDPVDASGNTSYHFKAIGDIGLLADGSVEVDGYLYHSKFSIDKYNMQITVKWSGNTATIVGVVVTAANLIVKTTYGEN